MKFLTDVNASSALTHGFATWVTTFRKSLTETQACRTKRYCSGLCKRQRIIATTDKDFEELIWRIGKPHFGVLRLENLPRAERRTLLEDVLANHAQDLASGAIVIAQTKKIRIRRPLRIFKHQQ